MTLTDRPLPQSPEVEVGILSCIDINPNLCLQKCVEAGVKVEAFYDLRNQTIYAEYLEMYDARTGIDMVMLSQRLKDKQLLEQIGGLPYLNAIQDVGISWAMIDYYLPILDEKYRLRSLIQTCQDIVGRIYGNEGSIEELLDTVERDVLRICGEQAKEVKTTKAIVQGAINLIEQRFDNQGKITGLPTGFTDLDKMTDGFHGGEMIVIAARPSMGKTSLALGIAEHLVLESKIPVGVFSLEMTAESLMLRQICSLARKNIRDINEGFLTKTDFPKLTYASGRLMNAPLFIDDTPGLSILQLRARARRMVQEHQCKIFIVDYLQLLHSTSEKAKDNRQQEIADISSGLKALAKELNVPVLVLSQLNREMEKDKARKPRMSDLRESGAIEQDADLIGLLYKPGVTNAEENEQPVEESGAVPINLLIAKQRNGPTGDVRLTFLKSFTRFEAAARVGPETDDLPME